MTLATATRPEQRSILCHGEVRTELEGLVECPQREGRPTFLSACDDCRFLTWRSDDRQTESCSTEERDPEPPV